MATIRAQLATQLKPLLPRAWKIVDHQTNLDVLDNPVVMLKQQSIRRAPAAPQGAHIVSFTVTVVAPQTDLQRAEDALDEKVDTLIHALDANQSLNWTDAEKVLFQDSYLAYDITLEVISRKD